MKNHRQERFGRKQRQYHRHHPWEPGGGLHISHAGAETQPDSPCWCANIGFILNGRRVMVWWEHPREIYRAAMKEQSWERAGPDPQDDWLFDGVIPNYTRVGRSRKKIVSYTARLPSAEQDAYCDRLEAVRQHMEVDGIDLDVPLSWTRQRLRWATSVRLIAPLEVRSEAELTGLARLARRLLLGETTLVKEFPDYRYGKAQWLKERAMVK